MNLEFVKKDNWEAEFEATADFNLHIEGVPEGQVRIYQRGTSDGEYAYVREATPYPSFADVYDYDSTALVYPKWIRVVVGNKPSVGVVTFNGDAPSGGGEQNKMRYFALHAPSFDAVYFSTLAKYQVDGRTLIGPTLMYAEESESIEGANRCIIAAAFNFNTKIRIGDNVYNNLFELCGISSVEEFIDRFSIKEEITEEQFYDPDFNPFE